MNPTVAELAKMIDHSLLHPTMTDNDLLRGCEIAKKYHCASVCVKPYDVKKAAELLAGSDVKVGTVISFPHGNSVSSIKVAETRQACLDGASEIDLVCNIGKVISGDYEYVKNEIAQVNQEALKHQAIVKVIFENDFLSNEQIIKLCEICNQVKVAFIKTSTGYGFVKQPSGDYNYRGATLEHLKLMRQYADDSIQIKAAGGVRNLDQLLSVREVGAARCGATATEAILTEAAKRFA